MEIAAGEEQVLMHLQDASPVLSAHRKRKHDDLGEYGAVEAKPVAVREPLVASAIAYEEPVLHGAAPVDTASSKKPKPPRLGHVLVKTLQGSTVRIDFPGTSITGHELKQKLEEVVGTTADNVKLMCGSQFVEDYDRISSATRLFIITQVGAVASHG